MITDLYVAMTLRQPRPSMVPRIITCTAFMVY